MKTDELSPKALSCWIAAAMLGPVAITAASSAWLAVPVAGILCALLCWVVLRFGRYRILDSKILCAAVFLWCIYAAAEVADQACLCFTGRGADLAVPLVLLFLSAFGASKGSKSACAVAATLWPLCVLIFSLVLAAGVGNIEPKRIELASAPPQGKIVFVLLLPMAAFALPRKADAPIKWPLIAMSVFAGAISLITAGTLSLPIALTRPDAFYEFSKSLSLFSTVQRFEAIISVGVVLSVYAMLSLLFSAAGQLGEKVLPGKGAQSITVAVLLAAAVKLGSIFVQPKALAIWTVILWGIVAIYSVIFKEKQEKSP